jgi:penicillin amidase
MPWRARRIFDRLSVSKKFTIDDMRDIQYDVTNLPLKMIADGIVKLNAASDDTLAALRGWDGRMIAGSKAALLVNEIRNCVAAKMSAATPQAPASLIRERVVYEAVDGEYSRWLPSGFANYAELLRACDASSRQSLADPKRLGPDETKWNWGRVFVSRFPHPLASAPLIGAQFGTPAEPLDGSGQTPDVGSSVSMRFIASPGNWDATRQVIPLGQSGDPESPYFADQFNAWRSGTPAIFPFTEEAVKKAAVSETTFRPK